MSSKEDLKDSLINKLTLHIEKLEMDNEINVLRDNLDEATFETGREHILFLKDILGKLLQDKSLSTEEADALDKISF